MVLLRGLSTVGVPTWLHYGSRTIAHSPHGVGVRLGRPGGIYIGICRHVLFAVFGIGIHLGHALSGVCPRLPPLSRMHIVHYLIPTAIFSFLRVRLTLELHYNMLLRERHTDVLCGSE